MNDADRNERRINIHFSPEIMAGSYANFANVSHSDYEFTITFARVDHEVEDEEIPGVVVSRINLSAKFMRELIDAMQDNYSKWETREGIKNLPEYGGTEPPPSLEALQATRPGDGKGDGLEPGRADMLRTAALTYGAQGGLAGRSFAINEMLRRRQAANHLANQDARVA